MKDFNQRLSDAIGKTVEVGFSNGSSISRETADLYSFDAETITLKFAEAYGGGLKTFFRSALMFIIIDGEKTA